MSCICIFGTFVHTCLYGRVETKYQGKQQTRSGCSAPGGGSPKDHADYPKGNFSDPTQMFRCNFPLVVIRIVEADQVYANETRNKVGYLTIIGEGQPVA